MLFFTTVWAATVRLKGDALGAYLQALGNGFKTEFQGDGAPIPFHERGTNFRNSVTINTYDLGYFRRATASRKIEFLARSNINLPQKEARRHER